VYTVPGGYCYGSVFHKFTFQLPVLTCVCIQRFHSIHESIVSLIVHWNLGWFNMGGWLILVYLASLFINSIYHYKTIIIFLYLFLKCLLAVKCTLWEICACWKAESRKIFISILYSTITGCLNFTDSEMKYKLLKEQNLANLANTCINIAEWPRSLGVTQDQILFSNPGCSGYFVDLWKSNFLWFLQLTKWKGTWL